MNRHLSRTLAAGVAAILGALPAAAQSDTAAATDAASLEQRVAALEAERAQQQEAESVTGARKVYALSSGVSLGGYGEATYENFEGRKTSEADFLRAVIYVGYKFNDRWLLNTEIEVEHGSTDQSGSTSVEFAYVEYLASEWFQFRAGMLLIPMGFLNEMHEPPTFYSVRRTDTENRIIPTTWRENGLGLTGGLGNFDYSLYLVNGLRADKFSASGLRSGRQKGSEAKADDLAVVARLDWSPINGLMLGGSAYSGDSGQDLDVGVRTEIVEGHVEIHKRGWRLRALYTEAQLGDVAALNRIVATDKDTGLTPVDADINSVGARMRGWYAELGYDVLSPFDFGEKALIPFARYETYDTQDRVPAGFKRSAANDVDVWTVGVAYRPIDEIIFKADAQFYDNAAGTGVDQWNLGMGYVF